MTDETLHEKRSRAAKESNKRWKDPIVRERRIEGVKKSYTKELREKRSKQVTNQWKETVWKEKHQNSKNYRENAFKIYDCICMRCSESKLKPDLLVHHIDGNDLNNPLDGSNWKILCKKCHFRLHKELRQTNRNFTGSRDIVKGVQHILHALKVDMKDPNFSSTPNRVARLYSKVFYGLDKTNEPTITTFPNDCNYDEMIIIKQIPFISFCSHHLVPFSGTVDIGYIPNKELIGLSKVNDIINFFAAKPQLQEGLIEEIVDYMTKILDPVGVMCIIKGEHYCMKLQGYEGTTITSAVRGCFKDNKDNCKEEFIRLIK